MITMARFYKTQRKQGKKMKKTVIAAVLATGLTAMGCHAAEWGYEGKHGPEHWGEIAKECATGKNQSPIDIRQPTQADLKGLDLHYSGQVIALSNNGHTLQGSLSGENVLDIDGKSFELKQFHFHTPSENLIQGKQYPLEAHFVHADKAGNLAVVAVMFESGSQNQALNSLIAKVPKAGEEVKLAQAFDVNDLIPAHAEYYRFNGSLTTPPCSEGVRWLVIKEASELSPTQTHVLMQAMGENNRPVQPLNARVVLSKE
ncbi:TPA: carbonic anhydrase [Vibrio vulnificus]|nr:carbonic anhydrase [Vibrio vulnificus]EGQ7986166.1 carbonic anhydrase [Vibrio vulnificus]EGQ8175132.1 carbonic anhydrase [Vibrio vulnificus]EGQ9238850.1 carbonic anhydrase [Vibrio vulnificus]EGQ9328626.1 carbonic anhydrase [Vibrio vulnificus]